MQYSKDRYEDRQTVRVQRLTHHMSVTPFFPSGNPDKIARAARRATKIASKGHRRFFASGW